VVLGGVSAQESVHFGEISVSGEASLPGHITVWSPARAHPLPLVDHIALYMQWTFNLLATYSLPPLPILAMRTAIIKPPCPQYWVRTRALTGRRDPIN